MSYRLTISHQTAIRGGLHVTEVRPPRKVAQVEVVAILQCHGAVVKGERHNVRHKPYRLCPDVQVAGAVERDQRCACNL